MNLLPGLPDPFTRPADKSDSWTRTPQSDATYLAALQSLRSIPLPEPTGSGRGVVIVGGGKYWPGAVVSVRMLRDTGCTLPVEVWYRGDCESIDPADLTGVEGVELIDLDGWARLMGDSRIPPGNPAVGGWEAKTYALTHTRFDTVLFLDADAYCVADPTPLFDFAEQQGALVYWSDLPHTDKSGKWNRVWPAAPGGVPAVQGGQLVIPRRAVWRTLVCAHWINQHSDHYYPDRRTPLYGDQDALRVALAVSGDPCHVIGPARWVQPAFVCEYGSTAYVVHRCQGKMFRPRDDPRQKARPLGKKLPGEARAWEHFDRFLTSEKVDPTAVFDGIYRSKLWGTGSGAGSSDREAEPYVRLINALARVGGWGSCVDLGCGDGRVAAKLSVPEYHGFDVSSEALTFFSKNAPGMRAKQLDFYRDRESLPAAEVLLCKDVLHHWPNEWVSDFLRWALACKKWRVLLFTQDSGQKISGIDTHLGGYRALSLSMDPLKEFAGRLFPVTDYLHKSVLMSVV